MMRKLGLVLATLVAAAWMTALAQPPAGDPDAKGTVSFTVTKNNKGSVEVSVTRGASTGWKYGDVLMFAVPTAGGKVVSFPVMFTGDPDDPPATGTATLSLPNETYYVWAHHTPTTTGPPASKQRVASALGTVTTTESTIDAYEIGGSVSFGANQPARVAGNAGFTASGTWTVVNNWKIDTENESKGKVNFYTVPTVGGRANASKLP